MLEAEEASEEGGSEKERKSSTRRRIAGERAETTHVADVVQSRSSHPRSDDGHVSEMLAPSSSTDSNENSLGVSLSLDLPFLQPKTPVPRLLTSSTLPSNSLPTSKLSQLPHDDLVSVGRHRDGFLHESDLERVLGESSEVDCWEEVVGGGSGRG